MTRKRPRQVKTVVCSPEYGVVTLQGGKSVRRLTPCAECPWRMDVPTGVFPPKAFETSATTAYDAAMNTFACHMAGKGRPQTCAGFMLRHAVNNLGVRLSGDDPTKITDGGFPIYPTYRDMAIANGVPADHPSLRPVRGNDENRLNPKTGEWSPYKEDK